MGVDAKRQKNIAMRGIEMYICDCCGRRFAQPAIHEEYQGECFGFSTYEEMLGCPYCGGSYEEDDMSERSFYYED